MAQQNPNTEPVQPKPHDEDEIVHTPTKHRARWIMGILLLVMILTTFTVGDEIVKLMTGQGRSSAYVRWNRPGHGEQSITGAEWQTELRSLGKLYSVLQRPLQDSEMKQQVAETLIIGALAADAGIAVSDKELGQFIVSKFGNAQNYHLILPQYRVSPTEFEDTLRQRLVVERYTSLMADAWNTPDIAEIEKSWKAQHQEFAFDYVTLPVESMMAEANGAQISDAELHTYFDGLPQGRKDGFRTKEKIAADVAGLPFEGAATEALFAKYPKPADEAGLEKQAQSYFDGFGMRRYPGKSYDEVKDKARAEGLAYASLQAWLADARARQDKGEAIDLAAETKTLGLALQHMPAAIDQSEWIASKPAQWMGVQTASLIFGNATDAVAGKFYPSVIVDETGFTVVQLTQKQEPAMPAFEEIAGKLREEMLKKKAKDLAVARLESLRDQFGTRPAPAAAGQPPPPAYLPEVEEAKFYEVARSAGLEAKLRDFKERIGTLSAELPAPVELYARTQPQLYNSKAGTVLAAGADFEGKNVFLIRVRGSRDPDPARMKANEFALVTSTLKQAAATEFRLKNFSLNALETRLGLVFNEKQSGG